MARIDHLEKRVQNSRISQSGGSAVAPRAVVPVAPRSAPAPPPAPVRSPPWSRCPAWKTRSRTFRRRRRFQSIIASLCWLQRLDFEAADRGSPGPDITGRTAVHEGQFTLHMTSGVIAEVAFFANERSPRPMMPAQTGGVAGWVPSRTGVQRRNRSAPLSATYNDHLSFVALP